MLNTVLRRGLAGPEALQFVKRSVRIQSEDPQPGAPEMPVWGAILLVLSWYAGIIAIVLVSYMLKEVVATLCMVETPTAAITVSASSEPAAASKADKDRLLETGPTISVVNEKPITASVRGTIRHVVRQAGRWARFRGFKIHILYGICSALILNICGLIFPRFPGMMIIASAISGASLCLLHASWTHKVVSMPTNKTFWQRIPDRNNWKLLAGPAALETAVPYISLYLAHGFSCLIGLPSAKHDDFSKYNGAQWTWLIFRLLSTMVVGLCLFLFLSLPAVVTLIRMEASLLPEDQDAIVPFDRSFDGKVVPKVVGGTGCVGFVDAWKSFNWEARRRLLKLYVKTFLIMTFLIFFVAFFVSFEAIALMGKDLIPWLKSHGVVNGHPL